MAATTPAAAPLMHTAELPAATAVSPAGSRILIVRQGELRGDACANEVTICDRSAQALFHGQVPSQAATFCVLGCGWLDENCCVLETHVCPEADALAVFRARDGTLLGDYTGCWFVWDPARSHVAYETNVRMGNPDATTHEGIGIDADERIYSVAATQAHNGHIQSNLVWLATNPAQLWFIESRGTHAYLVGLAVAQGHRGWHVLSHTEKVLTLDPTTRVRLKYLRDRALFECGPEPVDDERLIPDVQED
jgi:hypothetical protein